MTIYANRKQTNRIHRAMAEQVKRVNGHDDAVGARHAVPDQHDQIAELQRMLREASAQIDALRQENARLREQLRDNSIPLAEYARREGIHRSTAWRRVAKNKRNRVPGYQDSLGNWHVYV